MKKRLFRILAALGVGGLILCCAAPLLLATGIVTGGAAALLGIFAEQWVLPVALLSGALMLAGLWRLNS